MTTVSDNFNRSNELLVASANWVGGNGLRVSSNAVSADDVGAALWASGKFSRNQTATIDVLTLGAAPNQSVGVIACGSLSMSGALSGYVVLYSPYSIYGPVFEFYTYVNGFGYLLDRVGTAATPSFEMSLVVFDHGLNLYVDAGLVGFSGTSDPTRQHSVGRPGVYMTSPSVYTSATIDNFAGEDDPVDASPTPGVVTGRSSISLGAPNDGRATVDSPTPPTAVASVPTGSVATPSGIIVSRPSSYADITLGCAQEYEVFIVARDLQTFAAQVAWSKLKYSRVLDGISDASLTVPDVFGGMRCNIEFGSTIVPWRYGIRIECNSEEVWAGPITSISRPVRNGAGSDYVEITASDAMVWTQRRTNNNYLNYEAVDGGSVFKGVLDNATAQDNLFDLQCPEFSTNFLMTREVVPLDFEYTYDVLSELADSAVDFFMLGRELVVYDTTDFGWFVQRNGVKTRIAPTSDQWGRYIYGLFTDEAWVERPGYTIDGFQQANLVYVPGADSGEGGFRRYWEASDINLLDGVLTTVDVSTLYRPRQGDPIALDGLFQERADSSLALRNGPVVIISGGALSEQAPVTRSGLLPGSLWAIDLAETGLEGLLDVQRLQRVDFEVSVGQGGITEKVRPTLIPLGSDESVIG